jgi:orotidine-5'-phosphate decarboxylase
LNTAFFEVLGIDGMRIFDEVVRHIPKTHFVIADAKRGDIGNTSRMYAQAFLETFDCSAITVSPYMGEDSISPFLEFKNKYTIVLGLTSNAGAQDFEMLESGDAFVYQKVMKKVASWGSDEQIMFASNLVVQIVTLLTGSERRRCRSGIVPHENNWPIIRAPERE